MTHDLSSRSSRGGFFVRLRLELSLFANVTEVSKHKEQIINIVDAIPVGVAHTRGIHTAKVTQEEQHVRNGNLAIAIEIAWATTARIFAWSMHGENADASILVKRLQEARQAP